MKKFTTFLLASICFYSCYSQQLKESEVPTPVKAKFTSLYPGATNVKWEKEEGKYEAGFKSAGKELSVVLDANALLVATENEIAVSGLPQAVKDYVSKNLNGNNITEASKITGATGIITYEAEVGNKDYIFDANGNFIKTETDEPGDKEDND